MAEDQRTDERLEQLEEITISFATFKKTLKRDYLGSEYVPRDDSRSYVLRLYPSFEPEMEAEYYESEQGRHYDSNWNEKPYHIKPAKIWYEMPIDDRSLMSWPTEATVRNSLSADEIEEEGGIGESLAIAREMFWQDLKPALPETVTLTSGGGYTSVEVDINWVE